MPKLTPNQQAYKKQVKRIKRFYKNAEARGYRFETKLDLDIPKRVTQKKLKEISSIKPKELYTQAEFLDIETGKLVSGTEGRTIERRRAYYKGREREMASPYETYDNEYSYTPPDIVDDVLSHLQEILDLIDNFQPEPAWSKSLTELKEQDRLVLKNMLNGAIASEGKREVARRIEENASEVHELVMYILYGDSGKKYEGVQPQLIRLHEILYGKKPSTTEVEDYLSIQDSWDDEI